MYKRNLDEYLMSLTLPTNCMHCNYMLCNDDNHIQDIMHMHDDLLSACITTSSVIPDTKQTRCTRGDARSFFCTYKTYLYAQN